MHIMVHVRHGIVSVVREQVKLAIRAPMQS